MLTPKPRGAISEFTPSLNIQARFPIQQDDELPDMHTTFIYAVPRAGMRYDIAHADFHLHELIGHGAARHTMPSLLGDTASIDNALPEDIGFSSRFFSQTSLFLSYMLKSTVLLYT